MLITPPYCTVDQCPQIGHILHEGDPVALHQPEASGPRQWRVQDAWGQTIATGLIEEGQPVGAPWAPDALHGLGGGHYTLTLSQPQDPGQSPAPWTTTFAVMPAFDLAQVEQSPFGVMTHFSAHWQPDLIPVLARAGIKHTRDELFWDKMEPEPGRFEMHEKFRRNLNLLRQHHITPMTPMAFGHPAYDHVEGVPTWASAPYTEEGFKAYARYCRETLRLAGKQVTEVEIWNEYNGNFARGPADGRPEVYAQMLRHAYTAIKQERPDVKVLAGGTIGIPLHWLDTMFQHAGMDHMDGVSVHPYGFHHPPERLIPHLEDLRALIRKHNHGQEKPIHVTEQGWYLIAPGERGNRLPITEMTKACYLTRAWTIFLSQGVERSYWYLARNDHVFGTMGLVAKPDDPLGGYAPLPALVAYGTMIRQLNDAQYVARDTTAPAIYSFHFKRGNQPPEQTPEAIRVIWATEQTAVALRTDAPELAVTDMMGGKHRVHSVDGKVHLWLSGAPLYVVGNVSDITAIDAPMLAYPDEAARGEPFTLRFVGNLPGRIASTGPLQPASGEARSLTVDVPTQAQELWVPWRLMDGDRCTMLGFTHAPTAEALMLDPFPRLSRLDELTAIVRNTSATQTFTLNEVAWEIAGQTQAKSIDVSLQPGEEHVLQLPVTGLSPMRIEEARVEIGVASGQRVSCSGPVSYNPLPRRTVRVDGSLDDWKDVPAIDLAAAPYKKLAAELGGPDDLTGSVWLAWDEQHLYFAARVNDAVFDQHHTGSGVWKGDNFQLGLSTLPPWAGGEWVDGWQELGLTLTPQGPEVFRFGGPGGAGPIADASLMVNRLEAEGVTVYEAALPWRVLLKDGRPPQTLGFGLYLNDAKGAGRRGYRQWADIKRLDRLQPMRLAP